MLKRIFGIGLIFLSCQAIASHDGFYAGLSAASDRLDSKLRQTLTVSSVSDFNRYDSKNNRWSGSGFIGYGETSGYLYMAAEVGYEVSNAEARYFKNSSVLNTDQTATFTMNRAVMASLLPGYHVSSSSLLYGRFAYVRGHYKYTDHVQGAGIDWSSQGNGFVSGKRWGLGFATELTQNLNIRAEISRTFYQDYSVDKDIANASYKNQFETYNTKLELGLVYSFS